MDPHDFDGPLGRAVAAEGRRAAGALPGLLGLVLSRGSSASAQALCNQPVQISSTHPPGASQPLCPPDFTIPCRACRAGALAPCLLTTMTAGPAGTLLYFAARELLA